MDRKKVTLEVELVVPKDMSEYQLSVETVKANLNKAIFDRYGETCGVEKIQVKGVEPLLKENEYPFHYFRGLFSYCSDEAAKAHYAGDEALRHYYMDGWAALSKFIHEAWER